jgi:hypothetical protein
MQLNTTPRIFACLLLAVPATASRCHPTRPSQASNLLSLPLAEEVPRELIQDDGSEIDSAGLIGPNTESIAGLSIRPYTEDYKENGRTYHSFMDGKYLFPNDGLEQDRLSLQHRLFRLTFEGKLYLCPVGESRQLHRVLEVGTGTGLWAIEFGDEHPEVDILGIDLSPIQPILVPPNVSFQLDDLEESWSFPEKFDFIYSRMMTACFRDWPRFFEQCFKYVFSYLTSL